jgi:hypothetical protein
MFAKGHTTSVSSSGVKNVDRTSFGSIGESYTKDRFFHLATVFGLIL